MACGCGKRSTWVAPDAAGASSSSALVDAYLRKIGAPDPCGLGRVFIVYPTAGAAEQFRADAYGGSTEALTAAAARTAELGAGARLVDVCQ